VTASVRARTALTPGGDDERRSSRALSSCPLGRSISAALGLLDDRTPAIVEISSASGLGLLSPSELDAEVASTAGTGELVAAAVAEGARTVVVAAGGSAATDGGAGAIQAIDAAGGLRGANDLNLVSCSRGSGIRRRCWFGPS